MGIVVEVEEAHVEKRIKIFKQHNKKFKIDNQNFWLRLATDQVAIISEELAILELVKLLEEGENCRLVSQKTRLRFVCQLSKSLCLL